MLQRLALRRRSALPEQPRGISGDGRARGDVSRHHAARADDGVVANGDAGQEDRAAADPDVAADPDGPAALEALAPERGIAGMVGGEHLHGRPDLAAVTDRDLDHIEEDAAEAHEHAASEADVGAVVAMEGRPDDNILADGAKELAQERG